MPGTNMSRCHISYLEGHGDHKLSLVRPKGPYLHFDPSQNAHKVRNVHNTPQSTGTTPTERSHATECNRMQSIPFGSSTHRRAKRGSCVALNCKYQLSTNCLRIKAPYTQYQGSATESMVFYEVGWGYVATESMDMGWGYGVGMRWGADY